MFYNDDTHTKFKCKKYRYQAIKQTEQSKLKSKRQDYNMK